MDPKLAKAREDEKKRHEAAEARAERIFAKAAKMIAPSLGSIDENSIIASLRNFFSEYAFMLAVASDIGSASFARKQLTNLAQKADELIDLFNSFSEGALEIIRYQNPWDDDGELLRPRLSDNSDMDEPELPLVDSYLKGIEALAVFARMKAKIIEDKTRKGGRKPLSAHLYGSPEEWLAQACKEYSETNGCHTQETAIKMVHSIMEAVEAVQYYQPILSNGRIKKSSGRKAVRKVASKSAPIVQIP